MIKHYCDICERDITLECKAFFKSEHRLSLTINDLRKVRYENLMICPKCYEEISKFIEKMKENKGSNNANNN